MKITIESTPERVRLEDSTAGGKGEGVPARVWRGTTERGVPVTVLVAGIACLDVTKSDEFDHDLEELDRPPDGSRLNEIFSTDAARAAEPRTFDSRQF